MMIIILSICKMGKQKHKNQVSKMEDTLQIGHFPNRSLHLLTAKHFSKTFFEKFNKFITIVANFFMHDVILSCQVFLTSFPKQKASDVAEYVPI